MTGRCTLCRNGIGGDGQYCECGSRLHGDCHEGHAEWCPRSGEERWLGAVEY